MPASDPKKSGTNDEQAFRSLIVQSTTTTERSALPIVSDLQGADGESSIYFDMFRYRVANDNSMAGDQTAKNCFLIILGQSFHDESILQSILAVGALSLAMQYTSPTSQQLAPFDSETQCDTIRQHYYASLEYHVKALTGFRKRLQHASTRPSPRTMLMMTLLLAMYECQQGFPTAADAILESGSTMVNNYKAALGPRKSLDWDLSEIERIMERFGQLCKHPLT